MSFQDKDGKTALHDAGAKGQNDALKILLSASGVDVSLRDNMGRTALTQFEERAASPSVSAMFRASGERAAAIARLIREWPKPQQQ